MVADLYKETVKQVLLSLTKYISDYIQKHGSIGMNDENFHYGI